MKVAPGLISTIWAFIAVWLAWKSIEWLMVVWLRQVDADRVTEMDPDRRARDLAAERPDVDDVALGDGHVLLDDREVDVVDGARS